MKFILHILYSIVAIIALLYVIVLSFFGGGLIGLILALVAVTALALINTFHRKKSEEPLSLQSNNKSPKISTKSITVVVVLVIGMIPVFGMGTFVISCQFKRNDAKENFQPKLDEFEKIYLLQDTSTQETEVYQGGDCVDSAPYVNATTTATISTKTPKAIDSVTQSLKKQGYNVSEATYYETSCLKYVSANVANEDNQFNITFTSDNGEKEYCGYPQKVEAKSFNNVVIKSVVLRTR